MKHVFGIGNPYLSLSLTILLLVAASAALAQDGGAEQKFALRKYVVARPAMTETTLIGFTRARRIMDLVSEEAGRVVKVLADVGQAVGDEGVFAVLDDTFLKLSLEANDLEQKRLRNRIDHLKTEVRRIRQLVSRNTAPQAELDKIQQELDQAWFALGNRIVEEKNLRERMKRLRTMAQPGWKITRRQVEPGEWVASGRNIGAAGDYSTLLVPVSLTPDEYDWVRRNAPLTLTFPELGEKGTRARAVIERVSPEFDPETRKLNVDLAVKGLPEMRGGIRAELRLEIPDPSGAVTVPLEALEQRYEEYFLVRPGGERVRVVLLSKNDGMARVRSGEVRPGESFVLNPVAEQ